MELKVKPLGCLNELKYYPLCSALQYTVFDKEQLCPTLNAMTGGGRQPMIIIRETKDGTGNKDSR